MYTNHLYLDKCYLSQNEVFPQDLFQEFNKELAGRECRPYDNDIFNRSIINVFKPSQRDIRRLLFYPVTFSNGNLVQWNALKNVLIDNPVIIKAIEVALQRFGQERKLDGQEHISFNLLKYVYPGPMEVRQGPWHSDYGCDWSMITMLSNPNDWEGGRLQFVAGSNPARWPAGTGQELIQKTTYVQNKAIFFHNNYQPGLSAKGENNHSFEAMKITKPVERVILTIFQYDKKNPIEDQKYEVF